MTKQINLIELLSLFSPCDNFPKDFNVEILDRHGPNFTKKFCELVQEYLELHEDPASDLTNSLYTSIVDELYLDYESGDLQIHINSYIHKTSTTTKFITFSDLTYVLDSTIDTQIYVWNFKNNFTDKLESECIFDDLASPCEFWPDFGDDMLILSLTITNEPDDLYKLVIHCTSLCSEAHLNALACADYEEECK